MTEFFASPDDLGEIRSSELQSSLSERLGAEAMNALDPQSSMSTMQIGRRLRSAAAGGGGAGFAPPVDLPYPVDLDTAAQDAAKAAVPDTSIEDAKARVKQEGLEGQLPLPDQPSIKSPVLDLMIQEAHERRDREAAIARHPGIVGDALGLATSLGVGMIDPVNLAAFSIPVLGEARMGKMLLNAGDSIMARTGARLMQGAAQGAVGAAVLQPADWWLHTHDGRDYTMADALHSVVMSAGMGAAFHSVIGGAGDLRSRLKGAALKGSPEGLVDRGLLPEQPALTQGEPVGVAAGEEMPGISPAPETASDAAPRAMPELEQSVHGDMHDQLQSADEVGLRHPAEILADLPPRAQEDVVRAAIADMIEGRPVRAAELLNASADIDPRIAESMREPAPEWMSLEELVRDAAEPRRPMEQQDLRKVLDWLGVEKPEDIGPPQLDQWERGREQYFSENPTYLTPSMPVQFGRAVIDYFSRPATRLLSEDMTAVFDRRRTAEYRPPASAARGSSPGSAWRALADARPEYENPDAVAESKEAASTPEPASIDPTKTVSAAEAAAKQADDLWKETEPTLSEREYEQFNEVLQNLDREKADRESIIREGAACLAAAIA